MNGPSTIRAKSTIAVLQPKAIHWSDDGEWDWRAFTITERETQTVCRVDYYYCSRLGGFQCR